MLILNNQMTETFPIVRLAGCFVLIAAKFSSLLPNVNESNLILAQ